MDERLKLLAQEIYKNLPGFVRKEKCGRIVPGDAVILAIYETLVKEKEAISVNPS